jgi:hypothetical protein
MVNPPVSLIEPVVIVSQPSSLDLNCCSAAINAQADEQQIVRNEDTGGAVDGEVKEKHVDFLLSPPGRHVYHSSKYHGMKITE